MYKAIAYPDNLIRGVARVPGAREKEYFCPAPPPTKTAECEVKNRHESAEKHLTKTYTV